jgi:hypothetical protein
MELRSTAVIPLHDGQLWWVQKAARPGGSRMRVKDLALSLLPVQKRFERIFHSNLWGSKESVSGFGSTLAATENLRRRLPQLIDELGIGSILDVPCGDFNWMRHVLDARPQVDYTGFDIVPALVQRLQKEFGSESTRFLHRNVITDPLPRADLVVNRDFLIHMSFRDAQSAIANVKRSGSAWLLANTYRNVRENRDIVTGQWRYIDLMKPPYSFPEPKLEIEEQPAEGKMIALWRIADLA